MYRWIAILAAVILAISAAYGQSSSPSQEQPSLPLGHGSQSTSDMPSGMMAMDQSMMPMMQHMMQHMMSGDMMGPDVTGSRIMSSGMTSEDMVTMMCRGQIDMAGSAKSHLEARLAFVKSELAIEPAQWPAWQKYAETMRADARPMAGMHHAMATDLDFPARVDARVTMLEGQLSSLKAVRDAAVGLYTQLNAEQKKKADTLLATSLCM